MELQWASTAAAVACVLLTLVSSGSSVGAACATLTLAHLLAVISLSYGFGETPEPLGIRPYALIILTIGIQTLPPLLSRALATYPAIVDLVSAAVSTLASVLNYHTLVRIPPFAAGTDLDGAVVIVTGASAGIGFETATKLVARGATVIFACRSETKAAAAIREALRRTHAPELKALFLAPLDLSAPATVRKFAHAFVARFGRCEALVCNAGAMHQSRRLNAVGWEETMAANHLGHFLLARLLMPSLMRANGVLVAVSSSTHTGPRCVCRARRDAVGEARPPNRDPPTPTPQPLPQTTTPPL